MTPNLADLKQKLLHAEYLEAQSIYSAARNAGYHPATITALVYKCGMASVKGNLKENLHKAYKRAAEAEQRVKELETALTEANSRINELETIMGSNAQFLALADLINNPAPDRTFEDVEAELESVNEQPTPGEKQEDENHE